MNKDTEFIPDTHPYTVEVCEHCPILAVHGGVGFCKVINRRIKPEQYKSEINPECPLWMFKKISIELSNDLKKEHWGVMF